MGGPVVPGDIGADDECVVLRAGGINEFGVEEAMVEADGFGWIARVGLGGAGVVGVEDIDGVREVASEGLAIPREFAWR